MKYLPQALFAAGALMIALTFITSLQIHNPDWFLTHGDGYKLLAISLFAAAAAAQLIWGERRPG